MWIFVSLLLGKLHFEKLAGRQETPGIDLVKTILKKQKGPWIQNSRAFFVKRFGFYLIIPDTLILVGFRNQTF
jgi:hypothetical protein